MPYRSRKERVRVEATTEGLVADMVRQFADRYAFVRELVQNGIDAGATEIIVACVHGPDGVAIISIEDDGHGMSREIIEGPLLTLFNSEKDGDASKIGKYGVGFVSVFATDPDAVVVESYRGGTAHRLKLAPDHSYELVEIDAPPGRGSGTVVSLHRQMTGDEYLDHVAQVRAAALRWCRHAELPILFSEGGKTTRLDRPLAVVSPHAVRVEHDDMVIVVGPAAENGEALEESTSFGGFYHRGLTLHETTSLPSWVEGLRFKIESRRLSHTLSRDNVRQDAAYHRAMKELKTVVATTLPRELVSRVREAAESGSDEHRRLIAAAMTPALEIETRDLEVPLAHPIAGRTSCRARDLVRDGIALRAAETDELTRALAEAGRPIWLGADDAAAVDLSEAIGAPIVAASDCFLMLQIVETNEPLLELVATHLRAASAEVPSLRLVKVEGARPGQAGLALGEDRVVFLDEARRGWLGWLGAAALGLDIDHPAVRAARRLGSADPARGAGLLARYLLVEARRAIGARDSDALLASVVRTTP